MRDEVSERAQRYYEHKQQLSEKKQELSELRSNTFGTESEDVEEKARSLFDSVGVNSGETKAQEIEEVEQEVEELQQKVGDIEEELQRDFTEIRFPFNETIENREEEVAFPFLEQIPDELINALDDVIRNDINGGRVELRTDEIVVYTEDVEEAITDVETFADDIRDAARHELNTDEYVEKLATRDEKIQRMLYELYESDERLAKKELEERSGVESGGLRGVLYSVYDRDPYLVKEEKKYGLSEVGQSVMEKFVENYDKPEVQNQEPESEADEDEEESQMTLDSSGDNNE